MRKTARIVGVDVSLASTGLALVEARDGAVAEVAVRRVTSKAKPRRKGDQPIPLRDRSVRLRSLAQSITSYCAGADLVVVEGPSYASTGSGTWDRAGLWWLVVARLTGAGLNVIEVPPTNVKLYALGKGSGAGTDKDQVLAAVVRRYPHVIVTGNDEADALLLAAMGARFAGVPIEPDGLPQTHLRAMKAVRWTPTTT